MGFRFFDQGRDFKLSSVLRSALSRVYKVPSSLHDERCRAIKRAQGVRQQERHRTEIIAVSPPVNSSFRRFAAMSLNLFNLIELGIVLDSMAL